MRRTEPFPAAPGLPVWIRRLGAGSGWAALSTAAAALWIGQCMILARSSGHAGACLRPLACRIVHGAGWTDRAALSWLGWTALALACVPAGLCALEGRMLRWRHDPGTGPT